MIPRRLISTAGAALMLYACGGRPVMNTEPDSGIPDTHITSIDSAWSDVLAPDTARPDSEVVDGSNPYSDFDWKNQLPRPFCESGSYEFNGVVVVGSAAAPQEIIGATDVMINLLTQCDILPENARRVADLHAILDSEVGNIWDHNAVVVGTYDSNSIIRQLFSSREEFNNEVKGPSVIGRTYWNDGPKTYLIITAPTSDAVRDAAKELTDYFDG